jgi:hypothetical protein
MSSLLAFAIVSGLCFGVPPTEGFSQQGTDKASQDDELFRRYASQYVLLDGKYLKVPKSVLTSESDNLTAESCKVGQRGHLGKCKVSQVIGPSSMLVAAEYITTSISFLGLKARQSFSTKQRLVVLQGVSTKDIADGQDVNTPAVAIIATTTYKTAVGGTNTVPLAVPLEKVKKGLTRDEFAALLKTDKLRDELEKQLQEDRESERASEIARQKQAERRKHQAEVQRRLAEQASEAQREKDADANVQYAKRCLKRDEVDKAKKRLGEVVKEFPGTKAAEEAAKLLKELEAKKY